MAKSYLTYEQKCEIKKRLWNGEIQVSVARSIGMSPGSMQRVMAGYMWYDVPWPDGSTGPMSDKQRRLIARQRWDRNSIKNRHYGSAMVMREADDLDDARIREEIVNRAVARSTLQEAGIAEPTDEQIKEQELRDREQQEREQQEQVARDTALREKRYREAEEDMDRISALPQEEETPEERERALLATMWSIGREPDIVDEVADGLSDEMIRRLMEANMDRSDIFVKLTAYMERRKQRDENKEQGNGPLAEDQST